jgi:tetratricopeptide (TPR) repeat protein
MAGILSKAFEDDTFLDNKARSLFALNRREECEECYQEIIARNPDNIWFPVHAGDCFLEYGDKDFEKARSYYALAFDAAKKNSHLPGGTEDLYTVYEKVIDLAREMGETARADRLQRMLDSLRALSSDAAPTTRGKVGRNDPCPCGSGRKYKKCCGQNAPLPQQANCSFFSNLTKIKGGLYHFATIGSSEND